MERPRGPLPTRVQDLPIPCPTAYAAIAPSGLVDLGIDLPAGARDVIDAHVRLLLAWTARSISRRSATRSRPPPPRPRQPRGGRRSSGGGAERLLDLGSGGGFPGPATGRVAPAPAALLVESVGKKALFLRTAWSASGLERPWSPSEAERAETLAADPAHREAWPVVVRPGRGGAAGAGRAGDAARRARRLLVAWKRGPLADEVDAARGPSRPAGRRTGRRSLEVSLSRARGPLPGRRPAWRPRSTPAFRAIPAEASSPAARGRGSCAIPSVRACRRALGHPREPRGARRRARGDPVGRRGLAAGRRRGLRPATRTRSSPACATSARRRPRQPRRRGGRRARHRLVQRRRSPRDGVDPRPHRDRHRAWLAALPERLEGEVHARPRHPARPDLGVRHSTPVARARSPP